MRGIFHNREKRTPRREGQAFAFAWIRRRSLRTTFLPLRPVIRPLTVPWRCYAVDMVWHHASAMHVDIRMEITHPAFCRKNSQFYSPKFVKEMAFWVDIGFRLW